MDFPVVDEKSDEEDFPGLPSDDDEDDSAVAAPRSSLDNVFDKSTSEEFQSTKRKVEGTANGTAGHATCGLELDMQSLNAYARASLACLSRQIEPNHHMPRGKRTRRNAIHVSERAVIDDVAGSMSSDLELTTSARRASSAVTASNPFVAPVAERRPTRLRLLLLYFDLNDTILISDSIAGTEIGVVINKALSRKAFLRRDTVCPGQTPLWHNGMDFETASKRQAELNLEVGRGESVDSADPLPFAVPLLSESELDADKYINCWDARTSNRALPVRLSTFTHAENPGHIYRAEFERLMDKLEWHFDAPPDVKARFTDASGRYHFVLPGFFRSLCLLARRALDSQEAVFNNEAHDATAQPFDFRPIFRTYGTDLVKVVSILNDFAAGKHPGFQPRESPTLPNSTYRRCSLSSSELRRFHIDPADAAWYCHRGGVAPTDRRQGRSGPRDPSALNPVLRLYPKICDQNAPPPTTDALVTVAGDAEIFSLLCGAGYPSHIRLQPLGIRDDYFAWHAMRYSSMVRQ